MDQKGPEENNIYRHFASLGLSESCSEVSDKVFKRERVGSTFYSKAGSKATSIEVLLACVSDLKARGQKNLLNRNRANEFTLAILLQLER